RGSWLREHGIARGARRMGRRRRPPARRRGLTRLVVLLGVLAVAAAAAAYVHDTKPAPYARLLYPLRYEQIIDGHAANYRLDPALLAAVIYQESKCRADAKSASGAIGLMQLLPGTAQGIADRTGGNRFVVDDL